MPNTEDINRYELMVILSGELTEVDFEKELSEIRRMLQENTKGITYEDLWGRRDLTYRIKKQRRGYYVVFDFNAAASSVAEVRAGIKLNQAVLRHLLIALPYNYEAGRYKEQILREDSAEEEKKPRRPLVKAVRETPQVEAAKEPAAVLAEPAIKPVLAGKEEEEQLKTVEKKLEKILENPDIDFS